MSDKRKRKIESEHRVFNPGWTNRYLFTYTRDKILCLVCREVIAVPKEYNLRRHFESKHSDFSKLDTNEKQIKASKLLESLNGEQQFFKNVNSENESAAKAWPTMASAKRGKEEEKYCREWEEEKDLKDWLRPVVGNEGKAACRFCKCEMQANYANLQQHMATTKHQTHATPVGLVAMNHEGLSESKNSDTTAAILMKTEASCFSAGSLNTKKEETDTALVGKEVGNSTESFRFSAEPTLEDIRRLQLAFGVERGWGKYHQPRNLLLALVGEVGELAELFQWREDAPEGLPGWTTSEREALSDELSDVLIYLVALANKCHVDLPSAALRKIEKNRLKYPVEQVYGSSKKYTEYQK